MPAASAILPPVDEVLVDWSPGQTRIALLRSGKPWELLISRASRVTIVGNVYVGRVVGTDRRLGAAFVDIGEPEPGMLKLRRGAGSVHEGERVLVQATHDSRSGKGPALTSGIRLSGRHFLFTPDRPGVAASRRIADAEVRKRLQGLVRNLAAPDEGVVVRTAAAGAEEATLIGEMQRLRSAWQSIGRRLAEADPPALLHPELPPHLAFLRDSLPAEPVPIIVDDRQTAAALGRFNEAHLPEYAGCLELYEGATPLFEEREVEPEIDAVFERDWRLPGGGSISIERTRALTAVDVDTAGADPKMANLWSARETARLIRLRNVSGLIAVDFAGGGGGGSGRSLVDTIRRAFADDRASLRFGTISEFGLFEMSRERLGPALDEILTAPTSTTPVPSTETRLIASLRRLVRTRPLPPDCVIEADAAETALLDGPLAPARREAEARLGYPVLTAARNRPA